MLNLSSSKFFEVNTVALLRVQIWLTLSQLYEDDARIGHQQFDLKLTNRVKMSMVCAISLVLYPVSSLI